MATGEYAAAWDARNAANKLRETERVDAEHRHLDAPRATLATAQLLARHDQEARDLLAEQRVRAARLCLLYTSPSPRDQRGSRMPSSA